MLSVQMSQGNFYKGIDFESRKTTRAHPFNKAFCLKPLITRKITQVLNFVPFNTRTDCTMVRDFLFCPHTRPTTNLQGKEKGNGTVYQNYVPDKTTKIYTNCWGICVFKTTNRQARGGFLKDLHGFSK